MSKKLAVFMAIICAGLIAFVVWFRYGSDKTGPEIRCNNENLVYRDGMSDAELLEGVTAYDEKDGDVTASLTVESAYPVENGQVVVIYVAKDNSNNIAKAKMFYFYDQEASQGNVENDGNPDQGIDGGGQDQAPGADTPETTPDAGSIGEGDTETVSDENTPSSEADAAFSEGEQRRQEQEKIAEEMPAGCPRIYLTDYLVKVPVGTTVDRLSYVKEITDDSDNVYDLWTKIQIMGTLDTMIAGTYECTYYVVDSQGNTSNQAVLQFVVE